VYKIDFGGRSQNIQTIAGCSIGAIFALLLVLGYTVTEISIFSHYYFSLNNILSLSSTLSTSFSISDAIELRKVISNLMTSKKCSPTFTFDDLYTKTGIRLIVAVTELDTMSMHYIGHEKCAIKTMNVLDAVMASSAVPLLFPGIEHASKTYVDGALLDNYPITLFDPTTTLGFLLKNVDSTSTEKTFFQSCHKIFKGLNYLPSVVQWSVLPNNYKKSTVIITLPSNVSILGDGNDNRDIVVRAGYKSMQDFIEGKNGVYEQSAIAPDYFKFILKDEL